MDFQSEIKDIDEVTKAISITIAENMIKAEYETTMMELVKTAEVKGFRPGKAPRNIVENMHGAKAKLDVKNRLISKSLQQVIEQNGIDFVGYPDIQDMQDGAEVKFTAKIAIFPRPEIKEYEKFSAKVPNAEVTNEDVDKFIENLREQAGTPAKLAFRNTAKDGDIAEFTLQEVGVERSEEQKPHQMQIGKQGSPELSQALIGMEIGTTKEIELEVPKPAADHVHGEDCDHSNDPKVKTKFNLNLISLSEKVLPELNDDFAKNFEGIGSVLELRIKVRETLEKDKKESQKKAVHSAVIKDLTDKYKFAIPQVMIDEEVRNILMRQFPNADIDFDKINIEPFRKDMGAAAEDRVRAAIIVDRIAENENITISQEDFENWVNAAYGLDPKTVEEFQRMYRSNARVKRKMDLEITRDKVLEMLHSRTVVEVQVN